MVGQAFKATLKPRALAHETLVCLSRAPCHITISLPVIDPVTALYLTLSLLRAGARGLGWEGEGGKT